MTWIKPTAVFVDKFSAVPTGGSYILGQLVYNSTPIAGSYIGWICMTEGVANNNGWVSGIAYILNAIVNVENNIYKCTIVGSNNSTNQPTGISELAQSYADGYSWKYIDSLAVFRPFGPISE